jgi:DNA-directed RNA polymerase alpha subunit
MIRAIHARSILEALARTAEAGPVFDAVYKCVQELDVIARADAIEGFRDKSITDLEISIRLRDALKKRGIETVRQLELMTADELTRGYSPAPIDTLLSKKCLREVREMLASLGMKLKGDP